MKKYLIVFSNTRESESAFERILEEIKEKCYLKILYILDEKIPKGFSTWLMYMGFLGEEPAEEVKEAILTEIEFNAKKFLEELEKKLKDKTINYEVEFQKGNFKKRISEILEKEKFDKMYLPDEKENIFIKGKESLSFINIPFKIIES